MKTVELEWRRFLGLITLYGLSILALVVLAVRDMNNWYWVLPGLLVGGIFVVIALLYYYESFLSPLLRAKLSDQQIVEVRARLGQRGGNSSMWQWFLLPLLIQAVITAYFALTLSLSVPILGTSYTHPYQFGEIYNRVNTYFKEDTNQMKLWTAGDSIGELMVARSEKKMQILTTIALESFDPCLQGDKPASDSCVSGNIGMHLLLTKGAPPLQIVQTLIFAFPFVIAVSFGFIGVLFYILRDVSIRFATKDLYYKTFVTYLTRLIFAPVMCMITSFLFSSDWPEVTAPMLFFFIGYFPQRALEVVENRATAILSPQRAKDGPRPDEDLTLLQGMDLAILNRLEDLGIQKAQSLAFVDMIFLEQNFNTNPRRLADLVSQALLLIYTGEHFDQLVKMGIRDMVTLSEIVQGPALASSLQEQPKPLQDKVALVCGLLKSQKLADRLFSLNTFIQLAEAQEREDAKYVYALTLSANS